jgi:hypothetical protein
MPRRSTTSGAFIRPARKVENAVERIDDLGAGTGPAVADPVWDRRRRGPEHGLDRRRVGVDVGRHDDDLVRLEVRDLIEEREELIVQHLHLAHRPVARMDADRGVVAPERKTWWTVRTAAVAEREDVGLKRREGGREARVLVEVAAVLLVVGRLEDALELAPDPPQGGEQRMTHLEVETLLGRLGIAAGAQHFSPDLALAPDLRPVLSRRAEQEEVHLQMPGEGVEDLDVERRERRDAEERDPLRQRGHVDPTGRGAARNAPARAATWCAPRRSVSARQRSGCQSRGSPRPRSHSVTRSGRCTT